MTQIGFVSRPRLASASAIACAVAWAFLSLGSSALAQEAGSKPATNAPDAPAVQQTNEAEERVILEERLKGTDNDADLSEDLAFGAFQRGNYLTAFSLALPRAQAGDAAAQTLIAELYERGLGVGRDPKEAAQWYAIAAEAGNREAQFAYAVKLLAGKDVPRDAEKGISMMKKAADSGHAVAKFNYGQHLVSERPTNKGFGEALPYFRDAANAGVADAAYALSQIYSNGLGLDAPDLKRGLDWLLRAARAGIDTAQLELGIWLINGKAGVQDEKSGAGWLQRAAITGNAIAQNRLAHLHLKGVGVERDQQMAAVWYLRSRKAGHNDLELDAWFATLPQEMRDEAGNIANAARLAPSPG